MTEAPRVLIADDHPPMRAGARRAIECGGCIVCAEAATADEAIAAARRERPDVCLIDIRMPGNGIHAAAEITALLPGTAVVMLTVSSETDDLIEAINAGAIGYLLKDMEPSALPDAVRAAAAGEAPIPATLTARLLEELRRRGPRLILKTSSGNSVRLTGREWDVIALLGEGLSTAQIGERLFIDQVTVRRHISELMRKTGSASREELRRALQRPTDGATSRPRVEVEADSGSPTSRPLR